MGSSSSCFWTILLVFRVQGAFKMAKVGTFILLPVLARAGSPICQGRDPWYNGVETGACISNHAPFPESDFIWHCPWESNCLVSGYGCSTIKYDCNQNTGSIALLLKFYEDNGIKTGVAAECGGAR